MQYNPLYRQNEYLLIQDDAPKDGAEIPEPWILLVKVDYVRPNKVKADIILQEKPVDPGIIGVKYL